MLPDSSLSSAFATVPRRFSNLPIGCAMDPSWAETPEERAQRSRSYIEGKLIGSKYLFSRVVSRRLEAPRTREEEAEKQREMEQYFEQYEREYRPESLAEINRRVDFVRLMFL